MSTSPSLLQKLSRKIEIFWEKVNIRPDDNTIEIDYLANFLGIEMTQDIFEKNQSMFIPIIENRLGVIDLVSEDLKNRFMEKFPQIS